MRQDHTARACRDQDTYSACKKTQRRLEKERGITGSRASIFSDTGCSAESRRGLTGPNSIEYHGPCSPAEKSVIQDQLETETPDPIARSAAKKTKKTIVRANLARTTLQLGGVAIGTATGVPVIT